MVTGFLNSVSVACGSGENRDGMWWVRQIYSGKAITVSIHHIPVVVPLLLETVILSCSTLCIIHDVSIHRPTMICCMI